MDSLATSDADFGPKGWGAKALRVLACLAVRSVVVAARIMIVYCGDGRVRFTACSDCRCLFFVWPANSKRLQAAGCGGRRLLPNAPLCRVRLRRACTTQWLNRRLESLPKLESHPPQTEQRLSDTSCRSPQTPSLCSSVGIVALLGPTRTSCCRAAGTTTRTKRVRQPL